MQDVAPGSALADKVRGAQQNLGVGDVASACAELGGFVALANAQAGKKLSQALAATLIAEAQKIRAVLGC